MAEELDKLTTLVDKLDAINQVDKASTSSKYIINDERVDGDSVSTDQPLHLKNISKSLDLIIRLLQEKDQIKQLTGNENSEEQQTITDTTAPVSKQSTTKLSSILSEVEKQRYKAIFEVLGNTLEIGKFAKGPEANRLLTPSIDNREDVKQILPSLSTKAEKLKDDSLLKTLTALALAYNIVTNNISGTLQSVYRTLKNSFQDISKKVKNLFNGVLSLKTTITDNLNKLKSAVSGAFGPLKRVFGSSIDEIVKVFAGIGAVLIPQFAKLAPGLYTILNSFKTTIGTFVDDILKFLKNLIPSSLKNLIPNKPPNITTPASVKPATSGPASVKPPAVSGVLKPSAVPSAPTPGPVRLPSAVPVSVNPTGVSGVLKSSALAAATKPIISPLIYSTPTSAIKSLLVPESFKPSSVSKTIAPLITAPWYSKIPGAKTVAGVAASAKKLAIDPIVSILSNIFSKMGGAKGVLKGIGKAMNNPIVRKIPIVAPLLEVFFGKGDIEDLKNKRASNEITTDEELYRLAGQRVIKGVGGLIGGASGALLLSGLPFFGTLAGGLIGDVLGRIGAEAVTNYLLPKEATMDIGRLVVDSPLKEEELQDFLVKGDRVYKFNNKDEVLGMKEGGAVNSLISSITNTNERQFSISSRQVKILEEIRDGIKSLVMKDTSSTNNNYGGNRDNNSRPAPNPFTLRSEFDSMNNIATI